MNLKQKRKVAATVEWLRKLGFKKFKSGSSTYMSTGFYDGTGDGVQAFVIVWLPEILSDRDDVFEWVISLHRPALNSFTNVASTQYAGRWVPLDRAGLGEISEIILVVLAEEYYAAGVKAAQTQMRRALGASPL